MEKNELNDRILEGLQMIGGIFVKRGIPAIPVNLDYLDTHLAPDIEKIIVKDLISELFDLMSQYQKKEKKCHKYEYKIKELYELLEENTHNNKIIARKIA